MKFKFCFHFVIAFIVMTFESSPVFAQSEIRISLASTSSTKKEAVEEIFRTLFPNRTVRVESVNAPSEVAQQPVVERFGVRGAENRLEYAQKNAHNKNDAESLYVEPDYWIAIENYIDPSSSDSGQWLDRAVVIVQKKNRLPVTEFSPSVLFPANFAAEAKNKTPVNYVHFASGFAVTVGSLIQTEFAARGENVSAYDWQSHFGGHSRRKLLQMAVSRAIIKSEVEAVSDFPKKGILFRDISTLLYNPEIFRAVTHLIALEYEDKEIDVIAGLDARGFILGAPIALKMNKPFIPVRKKGKLPKPTHQKSYLTEYSEDGIEISVGDLKGKTVLIIDDLLATGGTLKATEEMFNDAGADTIYSAAMIELLGLNGQSVLSSPFFSLIQYP
jgi:adenine phosphoribosyltransferase